MGMQVITAAGVADRHKTHIVVSDVGMPGHPSTAYVLIQEPLAGTYYVTTLDGGEVLGDFGELSEALNFMITRRNG